MTCDAPIVAYYRHLGTCEVVRMHESDFAEAKRGVDGANWSKTSFVGLLQVCAYAPHGQRLAMAIQNEPGGPYVIRAGAYAGTRVDPRSGAAIGVDAAAVVRERAPEQSQADPQLLPHEWADLIGTDGLAN
ncbi:MAG: hypothetical protein WDN46_12745 [Methylocella sp.]